MSHCANAAGLVDALLDTLRSTKRSSYSGQCRKEGLHPAGGVDSVPFANAGLPTLNINTCGDEATTALWHTPQDTPDRVPWARIDDAVALFSAFLDRVAGQLP